MLTPYSPSGEEFLAALTAYFDKYGPQLMSGTMALRLQPRALDFISARFEELIQLMELRQRAPVEFLRHCAADLQDFKVLERLHHALQRVKRVRIQSFSSKLRDPTRLNVSCLQSLTQLELVGCDLSTSAWLGLEMVQPRLRALTCRDSLEELWHLLAPSLRRNGNHGAESAPAWLQLTSLRCPRNSIPTMDASLMTLPALRSCDLSGNVISIVQGLRGCSSLTELILSSNRIESVAQIGLCAGPLKRLVLQGNVLRSTKGIQLLPHLEELDLRCNLIASIHEVVRLSGMAALRLLWLADNPLALSQLYRIDVLACFPEDQQLLLDGTRHSSAEQQTASLRAQSNAPPESWRVLERFVNQEQHFRPWGSPLPETLPLAEDMWRPPSARGESSEGAPSEHASSSSRSRGKRAPARRIVEFSLAAVPLERDSSASQSHEGGGPSSPPPFAEASRSRREETALRIRKAGAQSLSSHGEDTKYYDVGDRRRSPPRYERSILERLHGGALEESSAARAADTGWDDDAESQSSSASSTAGSDGSVSPELQRTASLLISRSLSLGGALLGSASLKPQPKPP
ncbi:hypothetical protein CVIRNUC_006750 [Coccomyxa viridis]|uniref:Uncharacterized protein n=1 Tax=Coccomyxa viridis TaxID=1274662 RepID=A0AAV1I9J8_9CHLO|nr:hypothetical protein CVIRNUC_006750 [Coccomyxa viridis]